MSIESRSKRRHVRCVNILRGVSTRWCSPRQVSCGGSEEESLYTLPFAPPSLWLTRALLFDNRMPWRRETDHLYWIQDTMDWKAIVQFNTMCAIKEEPKNTFFFFSFFYYQIKWNQTWSWPFLRTHMSLNTWVTRSSFFLFCFLFFWSFLKFFKPSSKLTTKVLRSDL